MRVPWFLPLCLLGLSARGWAEQADMPKTGDAFDILSPDIMAAARPRWRAAAMTSGAAGGGFLIWPSLGIGAVIDSNPLQRHTASAIADGLRLTPRFVAEREAGLHATAFYGAADARLYPSRPGADQLDGRIGLLHDWAPQRNLILRLQGEVAQARDRIDPALLLAGTRRTRPLTIREASTTVSLQKTFGVMFASLGGAVTRAGFQGPMLRTNSGSPASSAETRTELRGRVGIRLGAALFAFAEPAANWRVLDAGPTRSPGSRVVAGLGLAGPPLVTGEAFAGVQRQDYRVRPRSLSEPVFGGRLTWSPDPAWTASVGADRGLAQATVATARDPLGAPIDIMRETASLRAAPSRAWTGELGLQHATRRFLGTGRRDELLDFDASLTVPWRHDLDLLADLNLTRVRSSLVAASYRRAVTTLGLRYLY